MTRAPVEPKLSLPEGRESYPSDQAYANFREVAVGSIAPGRLYRSASPIDPRQGDRRFVADKLLKASGAVTVVNTSDCRFRFKGFEGFDKTHYATLNHVALNMKDPYADPGFLEDMRNGLDFMGENEGPYLVHGTQGIQRTGYVCMVLEALMGADWETVVDDYMRSYTDYYRLSPDTQTWQAMETQALRCLMQIAGVDTDAALDTVDLAQATERYLLERVELTREQVDLLKLHLSKK